VSPPSPAELLARLNRLTEQGQALEAEGVPFPTGQVRSSVEGALAHGDPEQALTAIKRAESLYAVAARDWVWVKETLNRADELRTLAGEIGVDLQVLDSRTGNARAQLQSQPLSAASLGRAAASASLAVAVLHDAIPKFCVQESQKLGESIRAARNRGEEVTEAVQRFAKLLQAIQDDQIVNAAKLLAEVRRAVARIPRAPAMAVPSEEEEEILMEARNLARRLHRIKSRARNTQSAAKLMTQVRAALSEDRRYGTPEEEIEALWDEVDRLAKERAADEGAAGASVAAPSSPPPVADATEPPSPAALVDPGPPPGPPEEDASMEMSSRRRARVGR
jgi:hypothetical protein